VQKSELVAQDRVYSVTDMQYSENICLIVKMRLNSAYVDWKTFLSRLNIAGPKPG
jgi:hypothetical protein